MKLDKACADLIDLKKAAEAATLQAAELTARAEEQEKLAATLRQKSLLLEAFIKEYGDPEPTVAQPDDRPVEHLPTAQWASSPQRTASLEVKPSGTPRTRTKVTPEILESILSQLASGAKAPTIAKNLGLSTATVYNYVRDRKKTDSNNEDKPQHYSEHAQPNMLESY